MWFAIQESDDASFFGGEANEPSYIEYYFDENDLPTIEGGILKCERHLGRLREKLDEFFNGRESYNDAELLSFLIAPGADGYLDTDGEIDLQDLLTWYARLGLGIKILACVKEQGGCSFEVELS